MLEQAALGSGGVTVPGRVQNTCKCGTWGHGLVLALCWDNDDLKRIFQPEGFCESKVWVCVGWWLYSSLDWIC